jgi:polysaccharide pyruvyl transferase WcaK-like protein
MAEVQDADLVLSMRYHALAAAALAPKPAIALAYEPKVRALADELRVDVLDPADPSLASTLAASVHAAAAAVRAGERPSLPDAGAVARLRRAAGVALERALTGAR